MAKLDGKWIGSIFEQEVPSGTVNGSNTAFTLSSEPTASKSLLLFLNGLSLVQGVDYTISTTSITMTTAPANGQSLYAWYVKR